MTHRDTSQREDGFTYGGDDPATYGGESAATYGAQAEQRFRIRLRRGDRATTIDAVLSINLDLRHSDVSVLNAEVPRIDGLDDYKFGTCELFYGDTRLFRGRLLKWPGPGTTETATLEAPGPGQQLKRSELSLSVSSSTDVHELITQVWRDDTVFDATVYTPSSPVSVGGGADPFEIDGTTLEVLQTLHETAGMRWTVQFQNDTQTVESYVASEQPRTQDWDAIGHESTGDGTGYANIVRVYGGTAPGGGRAFAEAKDQAEIDALAADVGDGEVLKRIDDRTLTTDSDCQARADSELADALDQDTLSGTVDIVPELVLPGYYYDIPEWEADGVTPTLPIESVSISEGAGEASATLDVNTPDGPIELLTRLQRGQAQLNQP